MAYKCLEIFVRFNKSHLHGVHITRSSGPTCTQYLWVVAKDGFLSISFTDKDGRTPKVVHYNIDDVNEYTCEGYVP